MILSGTFPWNECNNCASSSFRVVKDRQVFERHDGIWSICTASLPYQTALPKAILGICLGYITNFNKTAQRLNWFHMNTSGSNTYYRSKRQLRIVEIMNNPLIKFWPSYTYYRLELRDLCVENHNKWMPGTAPSFASLHQVFLSMFFYRFTCAVGFSRLSHDAGSLYVCLNEWIISRGIDNYPITKRKQLFIADVNDRKEFLQYRLEQEE